MPSRFQLEVIVFLLTTSRFLLVLESNSTEAFLLLCLTLLSCILEWILSNDKKTIQNSIYGQLLQNARKADSQGISQGLLSLPWLFSGLITYYLNVEHSRKALQLSLFLLRTTVFSSCILLHQFRHGLNQLGAGILGLIIASPNVLHHSAIWLLYQNENKNNTGIVSYMQGQGQGQGSDVGVGVGLGLGDQIPLSEQHTPASLVSDFPLFISPIFLQSIQVMFWGIVSYVMFNMLMMWCKRTFTVGEGIIVTQAFTCLSVIVFKILDIDIDRSFVIPTFSNVDKFVICLMWGMLCFGFAFGGISKQLGGYLKMGQLPPNKLVAIALVLGLFAVGCLVQPALWVISEVTSSQIRAGLLVYWVIVLVGSLPLIRIISQINILPNILIRKGFHLLAVALFVPGVYLDIDFLKMALVIAFSALVVLELLRIANLPFIGKHIHSFMHSFVDSRDSGSFYVTHFSLLLGMSLPVWLVSLTNAHVIKDDTNALIHKYKSDGIVNSNIVVVQSGVLALGVADTAASVFGQTIGRNPVCKGVKKTWEGTFGGFLCVLFSIWLMYMFGMLGIVCWTQWWQWVWCTCMSCILEAVTTQLDNIVLPIHYLGLLLSLY